MELPKFKYSPNAYNLDLFKKTEGVCSVCNEKRTLKYACSFYSVDKPDYICPWCIENGKAAEKYDGEFNDYHGIEGALTELNDSKPAIAKELLTEIANKTPSYHSWQQQVWLTHCDEPCAFVGYGDSKSIKPIINEVKDDIEDAGIPMEYITEDSDVSTYLFQCLKCGQHRLHIDFD